MGTVVGPNTPIVVGLPFEILLIFVVQERDDLVQHRLGNGSACAKHRSRELECEIGADALGRDKIREIWVSPDAWRSVKFDALVDAFADHIAYRGVEVGLR